MKYKWMGILACMCSLVLVITTTLFAKEEDLGRKHQHVEALEKEACSDEDVFCTHLPLVMIDTQGVEIPGKAILDENGKVIDYTLSEDGNKQISAQLAIVDHEETNNLETDQPTLTSDILIHVRGNSSRTFDKSGYSIRLVTETGENDPQVILGMDAHHEWALHGPFIDKSLIRNYLSYNLAGEMMDYAPNVRFCEVILNGEYRGVYLMVETITAGDNGARLELKVDKKDNTFSGYLVRLDRGSDTEIKNIDSFSVYTYRTLNQINIEYPGVSNLTEEMAEAIRQDFSDFEKIIYSYDFDDPSRGYEALIDVDSFVDYFLINEFTCNYDAGWLSTYVYKGLDGKFHMCVWDFNSAFDAYQHTMIDPNRFDSKGTLWFNMLLKDENFTERVISRYYELRETILSDEYLLNYIDETVEYLGPAVDRNFEVWGYTFNSNDVFFPTERNPRSYEEAIQDMKDFITIRGKWLDENIETIRQYSAESATKKFNEDAN